jgi:hypothetical protein
MLKLGLWPPNPFSENICLEFFVLVLCSVFISLTALYNRYTGTSASIISYKVNNSTVIASARSQQV